MSVETIVIVSISDGYDGWTPFAKYSSLYHPDPMEAARFWLENPTVKPETRKVEIMEIRRVSTTIYTTPTVEEREAARRTAAANRVAAV